MFAAVRSASDRGTDSFQAGVGESTIVSNASNVSVFPGDGAVRWAPRLDNVD